MKFDMHEFSVRVIRELWQHRRLVVNHEYQRAPRWTRVQQHQLIDSLLRGYPLPLFFIHRRPASDAGEPEPPMELVDGQQRLLAMVNFIDNQFKLLNPPTQRRGFPGFIIDSPELTPWAGKRHNQLDAEDVERLENIQLQVGVVETDDDNDVRDLFVRLQAGSALKPQEKRDALPGGMTTFIKQLGGWVEEDIGQLPRVVGGHQFFKELLRLKSPSNSVTARQVAAQMVMNLMRAHVGLPLASTKSIGLDPFYHEQVGFDPDGDEARRIVRLFDEIADCFSGQLRVRPARAEWIHLVQLWQRLRNHYQSGWETRMPLLVEEFKQRLADAKEDARWDRRSPIWTEFGGLLSGLGWADVSNMAVRQEFMDGWFIEKLDLP